MSNFYNSAEQLEGGLDAMGQMMGGHGGTKTVFSNSTAICWDMIKDVVYVPRAVFSSGLSFEELMLARGRIMHEFGHKRHTKLPEHMIPKKTLFKVWNALEDCWMEREQRNDYRGCALVLPWMSEFYNKKIAGQISSGDVDAPLWEALCAMGFMSNGIIPAWRLTEKAQAYYDAGYEVFCEWKTCKSSKGTLKVAEKLYDILKDVHKDHEPEKEQEPEQGQQGQQGQQGGESEDGEEGDDSQESQQDGAEGEGAQQDGSEGQETSEGGSEGSEDDSDDTPPSGNGGAGDFEDDDEDEETEGSGSSEGDDDADADDTDTDGSSEDDDDTEGDDSESDADGDDSESGADGDNDDEETNGSSSSDGDADGSDDTDDTGGSKTPSKGQEDYNPGEDDPKDSGKTDAELDDEMDAEIGDNDVDKIAQDELDKVLGDKVNSNAYTSRQDKDSHEVPNGDRDYFMKRRGDVSTQAMTLTRALEQALRAITQARKNPNQRQGRIDFDRLPQIAKGLSKEVFYTTRQGIKLDTAVEIIIDESGSMGNIKDVQDMAIAIGEALSRIGVPFEITGTTTTHWGSDCPKMDGFDRTNPIRYKHYKVFNEQWQNVAHRTLSISSHKHNVDGEAIEWCAQRLAGRPERRKVIFSINDGEPCAGHYNDHRMQENLMDVCKKTREAGTEVYGFGIGTEGPARFYGAENFIGLENSEAMGPEFLREFSNIITGGRVRVGRAA